MSLEIKTLSCLDDNFSYVIFDTKSKKVAVVDPSDFKTIDSFLESKYKKLDFILNTHHHLDHIGGNLELKSKYKSKILEFHDDCYRIEKVDIKLKENEIYKIGNSSFEIFFLPGHTKNHIAFYFKHDGVIFTGDTLFSFGCGRIFEGTYQQMFSSLEKIKKLPPKTKIYCGHEYTLQNSKFCIQYDKENQNLIRKIKEINEKLNNNEPTVPSTLEDELKNNILLRRDQKNIKTSMNINNSSALITFSKLRDLKDNF